MLKDILDIQNVRTSINADPEKEKLILFEITLNNKSETKTLQAISEPVKMFYDQDSNSLNIGLSKETISDKVSQEPAPSIIHKPIPATIAVPPGGSAVVSVSVPFVINRLVFLGEPGKIGMETSNVTNTKHVSFIVEYSPEPIESLAQPGTKSKRPQTTIAKKTFDIDLSEISLNNSNERKD